MTPNFYTLIKVSDGTSRIVWSHHRFPTNQLYESKHTGKQYVLREHIQLSDADIQTAKELPAPAYFVPITTIKVIEVQFPTGKNKGYFYYIKEEDAAYYTIGDKITIDAARGRSAVTVKGIYNINQTSVDIATKLLPIVEEYQTYIDVTVKYLNTNGYSSNYTYSISNIYTTTKHPNFIYLLENKTIVKVVNTSDTYRAANPHYRFKSISGVDRYDIEEKLKSIKKLNPEGKIPEEIKNDVIKVGFYFDFFNDTTTTPNKYENLNKLASGIKQVGEAANNVSNVITQLTYEGDLINAPSKCNCATQSVSEKYECKNGSYIMNLKEEKSMMNKMFKGMAFGEINTGEIKYSFQGMSFRGYDGRYTAYCIDKENGSICAVDVGDMVMDIPVMAIPVSTKDVKIGDVIVHQSKFVIVKCFYDDGTIGAIDPVTSTEVSIIPVKNIFGFNCVSKILNFFDNLNPSAEAPFGDMSKMLPFMMMGEGGTKNKDMFLMMALADGNMDFTSNPMLMMAMMQD